MFLNELLNRIKHLLDISIRPIFWLLALLLGVLILNVRFNIGEDLLTLHYIQSNSMTELLTSSYLGLTGTPAFRPAVVFIQKVILETFNFHYMPLRFFFVAGYGIFMWQLNVLFRELGLQRIARYAGLFYVLSATYLFSPKITIGYTGALLLLILFVVLFRFACRESLTTKDLSIMTAITVVAPFFIEHGVLCYVITGIILLRCRRWEFLIPLFLGFFGYFWCRSMVLDAITATHRFPRASGYWFAHYEKDELTALFEGKSGLPYYLYTMFAQFLSLFTSQPTFGAFTLSPNFLLKVFRVLLLPLSTLLLVVPFKTTLSQHRWPWLLSGAVILANSVLSFSYARPRIMMVASVCYAILFGISFHAIWKQSSASWIRLISIIVIMGWVVHFGSVAARVIKVSTLVNRDYATIPVLEDSRNEIYQHVRDNHFLR